MGPRLSDSSSISSQSPPSSTADARRDVLAGTASPAGGWLAAACLVAGVFVTYHSVLNAGFIWDDDEHLTANPCIVGPLGFKAIWTSSAAVYYPLVLTTFWVQHALWGLHPMPYHLVNVAMHAGCAVLLWRVLRRLKVTGAWLGAAIWALHPVEAESVAWITELKNTQSCWFYLLSILAFLRWRAVANGPAARKGEIQYALALLAAVLAILSKASTVMLPVVLALCWWWQDRKWQWRNWLRLAPFFLISAVASGWTIWQQRVSAGAAGGEWIQSRPERLVVAGKAIWFYLGKLLWPHPLIFIYPRWTIDATHAVAYLPIVAAVGTLAGFWLIRHRQPALFFAFAYFVVSLFPVLDFFNVYFFRYSFVGDHFQYLAAIGPLALAGAAVEHVYRTRWKSSQPLLAPALAGALLLGLGLLTWRQTLVYHDEKGLWQDTIAKNPNAWMAHANLGACLAAEDRWDEAIAEFDISLDQHPQNDGVENSLGIALLAEHKPDEAMQHFRASLAINPDSAHAHNDLGIALGQKGRLDEAISEYRKALELDASLYGAWMNMGKLLERQGKLEAAVDSFRKASELASNDPEPFRRLGNSLAASGRSEEAAAAYRRAAEIESQSSRPN